MDEVIVILRIVLTVIWPFGIYASYSHVTKKKPFDPETLNVVVVILTVTITLDVIDFWLDYLAKSMS